MTATPSHRPGLAATSGVAQGLSLDALAAEPTRVAALPAEAVAELYPRVARLEADLRAQLLAARVAPIPAYDNRALGLAEAAGVLGMKPATLYRKWRALGLGYRDADGHVKFTRAALSRYLARHTR